MRRPRLRDLCALIGYVMRRRWAERAAARRPFRLYVPSSPASLALMHAEEDRYAHERIQRRPEQPDRRPGLRGA